MSCQGILVCRYTVTATNITIDVFPTNIDPFAYNTTLCYTSIKFMGIMIDIGASKRSIAGYS